MLGMPTQVSTALWISEQCDTHRSVNIVPTCANCRTQEQDQAVMVVVDVYGGQLQQIPPALAKQRRAAEVEQQKAGSPAALPPLLRLKQCVAHQLDYQLFASRKGLLVRQVRARGRARVW